MKPELKQALSEQLLALADDELILGHRNSEWCGHAPILEEDIAFANIALDEIGHSMVWYSLLADLHGKDRVFYPNELVYQRSERDFYCVQLVELPKGDWAFSMVRQYLFDVYEKVRLEWLANSQYTPIAEAAAKMRPEESYHLRHTQAWLRRLGLGTEESNRRMQTALDHLWDYAQQLFQPLSRENLLVEAGYLPETHLLREAWEAIVVPDLREAGLRVPESGSSIETSRQERSSHFSVLLQEMQSVARLYPDATW